MILYGIPNCNTVKKARDWLANHGVAYTFYDVKKQGVSDALLANWLAQVPHETLINRAGLTWRGLDDTTKSSITTKAAAIALMQSKPSVIKRPVLVSQNTIICVGFNDAIYQEMIA
jgi:Spx/MgsR family transcriptional regulator